MNISAEVKHMSAGTVTVGKLSNLSSENFGAESGRSFTHVQLRIHLARAEKILLDVAVQLP